ncbi:retroelement silencing factor 1 isoform 1-T2 [Hipposideros larvatus]
MDWTAKPESVTLPPMYPKNQSSFLDPTLINTPSQSSLNYPGSNQETCMFLSNSDPVSQPLLNFRNYKTPQQISVSDMHSGSLMASQTSVERIAYANVKGPKQVNHNLQMSSGVTQNVWSNSPVRNSMFSHTGAAASQQTGFGTNTSKVHAPQNQFVTPDVYSVQVQMIPSKSVRVPVTYLGNRGLNSSLSERQGDWAQQYTSNGLTHQDYRLPKQYIYSSQNPLQDPTLQKQNPMPPISLQVKNNHPPNSALTLQSQPTATVQSFQYAVTQTDRRPPPPYNCRYASQPLQSTQHVIKHCPMEVPQSQKTHLPEMRKDFCRGFQQQWQNLNENVSTVGNFCNLKVNTNVSPPFNEPIRSSVDGVQILAQNNQEVRADSCNLASNQALDTSATKEKLVRDIKTLVEMKRKFSELARKVKINKDLLTAAGCIKTTKTSYSKSAQNSELSMKQTAKIQSGPQVTPVTSETAKDKLPTVMETAEERNRTHSTLNSNMQDTNCKNLNQVNSILLNPVCAEKLPMPDKLHDLEVTTSLQTPTDGRTHTISNNTQFSSGNFVNIQEHVPTKSETTLVPQPMAFEEYASKYVNKNRLLLSLLAHGDKVEEKLFRGAHETIQDSKPHCFEMNPNTQITGNQLNLKTLETPSTCNTDAKISDSSFCLERKSSTHGISSKSGSHCSMELLTTCLSLWKKQPLESTEKKQCDESRTNSTAVGISKPVDICDESPSFVGNSQNMIVNSSQPTSSIVVQNYESPAATVTKGTELQVAVVSPLILSDVKTLPVKRITSEDLSATMYPVIKEDSVCSLQNQLAENSRVTTALKVNETVAGTTSIKIFPLTQKDRQNESTKRNSESTPNTNQGKHIRSEPDSHYPVSDQQACYKSKDSDIVSSDMLQIDNICSLVEGDLSYNSKIAKIFNSLPVKKVEPQKSLPNHQVMSSKQKEQLDSITAKKDFGFQKDNCVQCTDVSHETPDQSKSLQPPESNSEILEERDLEHITKIESTAEDMCSSAAIQQDSNAQEMDVSCSYTAQDPARNEILNKTPMLYLHDQLSELLKEFPYGIEPVNAHEVSVAQQITGQDSKDQTCDKTSHDSEDSADQIQITILNSEQMKELFPEQDDQPSEVDKLTEPQKAKPITNEGSQCDLQVHTDGEDHDSLVDSEKDDVRCCALGWLSVVYEGVPQCQCNSIMNSTSKEEKEKDQCSPLETNSCKQGESTSDRDVPTGFSSPPNNPRIALTFLVGNNDFPEIEQNKPIKDTSQTKHNSPLRTKQELSGQPLSKGDKSLNSLQSHKRKRGLKFHEVTFHSSNKRKFSQESRQRKPIAQNSHPLKAKTGFLTNKSKDLHMKNGSVVQSILPEKRKLKAGDAEQKVAEKRKSDRGSILDSEIKRMKYDKQEQKKRGGTFKISNFLSTPSERARVSNITFSGSKHSSCKINRVLSQKEYLQRQKHKEAMGSKASKKNTPCDSQYMKSSKLSPQVGSCGKSNKRPSSSVQTSKESNICTSHGKNLKIHHFKESKSHISRNVKGTVGGKQPDKMWVEKTNLEKNVNNINNEIDFTEMSSQAKEPTKQYLNRVAFKCTEQESICITEFGNLPRKVNKEKRWESKIKNVLPKKDATEKQSMLQFKLCPDGLINKSTNSTQDQKDLKPCPRKEQAPVQGIKSTKEDWLKGTLEEKRIPEANQEIDDDVLTNSRIAKKTFGADGCETLQNPVKDSKAMFQTYKKMYMEKKSRSLGSSPLK